MLKIFLAGLEAAFLSMFFANFWIISITEDLIYSSIDEIPPKKYALVLGTSPRTLSGGGNPYFLARVDAAAQLYHCKKVEKIIVSGEKSLYYDEPLAMKNYLVSQEGISEQAIIEDKMGFNTQRSVIRCKKFYLADDVIIVSQKFHNFRSLFFARNEGMKALAFEASDVSQRKSFYRNHAREFLARVQAVFFHLFGILPDLYNQKGEKVLIVE